MKRYIISAIKITLASALGVSALYFGTAMLNNLHLDFIRAQSRNVVTLINKEGGGGTGFIVRGGLSGDTYIMTNHHICSSAGKDPLLAIYRGDMFVVPVLRSYVYNDLCAVTAPSISTPMTIARSVRAGERVYAIGHPLLEPITMTEGELSASLMLTIQEEANVVPPACSGPTYEIIDLKDNMLAALFGIQNVCIRHLSANSATIPILPGNSGSPIVNIYGNVVGVAFAANESGTHSYIVPLEDLKDFLGEL